MLLTLMQVGQGLSKDAKARKLAFQHWIEAVSTHQLLLFFHLIVVVFCLLDIAAFVCSQMCVKRICFLVSVDLDLSLACEHGS
jgi:hypothetical protein